MSDREEPRPLLDLQDEINRRCLEEPPLPGLERDRLQRFFDGRD